MKTVKLTWPGLWLLQFTVLAAMFPLAWTVFPWISCRPLTELLPRQAALAPAGTACYNDEHMQIVFYQHGTITAEPVHFGIYAAAFLILWGWLIWSHFAFSRPGTGPNRQRGTTG